MCGIVATIGPKTCEWVKGNALDVLSHRGPDYSGHLEVKLPWCQVTLGATRLSIVDPNHILVPQRFADLWVSLAYNGEVYNWQELKRELPVREWETTCDAEVLAHAYRQWGVTQFLSRLNGMWAFVLVDELESSILISCDRVGKKPLYWVVRNNRLYLSSEIKALPVQLIDVACQDMDALEFDFRDQLPLMGIHSLEPGKYILLNQASDLLQPQPRTYYMLPDVDYDTPFEYDLLLDEAEDLVKSAITLRAKADVKVAVQLSGGLDSALVQHVTRCSHLYCVDFPADGIDNLTKANLARAGVDTITSITFNHADLVAEMPRIAWHLDTPATWTAVCQWFMNKQISMDGCRVVLQGEGADELAGGYSRYRILWWLDQLSKDPHLEVYQPLRDTVLGNPTDILLKMLDRSQHHLMAEHTREIIKQYGKGAQTLVDQMARIDFYTTMQVLLRMADRMTAAWGLENRDPFLDYRLVDFFMKLPGDGYKVTGTESKTLLRGIARRWGIHPSIINEKTKRGLFLPWSRWTSSPEPPSPLININYPSNRRGEWNRSSFARYMRSVWKSSCLRDSTCNLCHPSLP